MFSPVHSRKRASSLVLLFITLMLGSCTSFVESIMDNRYGKAQAREYVTALEQSSLAYDTHIKPLIERRCTVCHGCYDAPCQLKLDSYQGLLRGAHKDKVYDGTRLLGATLTRLFEDAHTTEDWRNKGFYPVLNERTPSAENNHAASVLARLLTLKQDNPLPRAAILPESFTFSINRDQQCPKLEDMEGYEKNYPLWGMPFGLPGLSTREHELLMDWLEQGANPGKAETLTTEVQTQIDVWEDFLNRESIKAQLVNRYIYEHLFLAKLHFSALPDHYFQLVRSHTPPGAPLQRISTARPFDDPKTERVYYRLWRDPSSVVAKNHMPYLLDDARMQRWQELFYADDYPVTQLPGYEPGIAANPFATFVELPVGSRYRFMLEEAQFTIMNFIKGPVCRGQVALNVIQDHFWVFFVAPELMSGEDDAQFLSENSQHLQLPASIGNTFFPLSSWHDYSEQQKKYLAAKSLYVQQKVERQGAVNLEFIWDGEGKNQNAALTIFRHSDSASVVKGLVGNDPQTAWVIGYPLLERIHYLLVAGFDVYGNVSHQLLSRLYMDFLRMEGELTFLDFLPRESRQQELKFWYRGAEDKVHEYLGIYEKNLTINNAIDYQSDDHKTEFYRLLKQRLRPVLNQSHALEQLATESATRRALDQLQDIQGKALRWLPQTTIIHVPGLDVFTLMHNNAYSNLSSLFNEDGRRIPAEDSLTLARGIIGAYPNAFILVSEDQLPDFVDRLQKLTSESDYQQLRSHYGIRRSDPDFWYFSDQLHAYYNINQPGEAGLLDYNRLENR